jgi:hypothetical protein
MKQLATHIELRLQSLLCHGTVGVLVQQFRLAAVVFCRRGHDSTVVIEDGAVLVDKPDVLQDDDEVVLEDAAPVEIGPQEARHGVGIVAADDVRDLARVFGRRRRRLSKGRRTRRRCKGPARGLRGVPLI